MGKLRDLMLEEMKLRNLSPRTIRAYMSHMERYTKLFGKSPASMGEVEIRKYLRYLREERKVNWSNINVAYNAIRFFYIKTLNRKFCVEKIPRPKTEHKLPIVLSKADVKSIIEAPANLKHKKILMALYSTGCRLSEVTHLKVTDIDSKRMQVRVEQGKGKKDRYTLLSETLLIALRDYWRKYTPRTWLFFGCNKDNPLTVTSIQRAFKDAKKKAGIKKPATIHTLRHSFATHLLESGADLFTIQKLLGHENVRTTGIYIHVQRKNIIKIVNPLDRMEEQP